MSPPITRSGWRRARLVVVDLETTGLDPRCNEIISFAAIPIRDGRIQPGELTTALVRPRQSPAPAGIRIHGLRPADLAEQPPIEERRALIETALQGAVMVAHCAWIETEFLAAAFAPVGGSPVGPVIDTMALGVAVLRARGLDCDPNLGLSDLARSLGLPVHRPHHADGDALTTAQAFLALASHMRREDGRDATIGELMRAGQRRRLRDLLRR